MDTSAHCSKTNCSRVTQEPSISGVPLPLKSGSFTLAAGFIRLFIAYVFLEAFSTTLCAAPDVREAAPGFRYEPLDDGSRSRPKHTAATHRLWLCCRLTATTTTTKKGKRAVCVRTHTHTWHACVTAHHR